MNRTIEYLITEKEDGLRIEQFLRRKGYSGQNLAEIKLPVPPGSFLLQPVRHQEGSQSAERQESL